MGSSSMEISLNLCWLLLAVPALVAWRRQTRSSCGHGRGPLLRLGVLTCALIMLFPVISASDDLHALRQEMEESASKLKASGSDRGFHSFPIIHLSAAIPARTSFVSPVDGIPTAPYPDRTVGTLLFRFGPSHGRAPPALVHV